MRPQGGKTLSELRAGRRRSTGHLRDQREADQQVGGDPRRPRCWRHTDDRSGRSGRQDRRRPQERQLLGGGDGHRSPAPGPDRTLASLLWYVQARARPRTAVLDRGDLWSRRRAVGGRGRDRGL